MTPFSCVLVGGESLLVGCGDHLLERGHTVRGVISRDPGILDWAAARNIPSAATPSEIGQCLDGAAFDWLFSIANLSILPDDVLALPRAGSINFHDGPLPRYAGLNTPAWALLNGERDHGVSWHLIADGIDEGDIVASQQVPIGPDDTSFTLNSGCYAAALESFARLEADIAVGRLDRQVQNLADRSYFGRTRRPEGGGILNPSAPAETADALCRAMSFGGHWNPLVAPKLRTAQETLLVESARPDTAAPPASPGQVMEVSNGAVLVGTGSVPIRISGFARLDGRSVDPADFLSVGDILPLADAERIAGWTAAAETCARSEMRWRDVMRRSRPARLTLVRRGASAGDWQRIDLAPAEDESDALLAAATGLWAQRSTGDPAARIALAKIGADTDLAVDWVPLALEADDGLTGQALVARARLALEHAQGAGPMARDLAARDPELGTLDLSDIGLSLTGEPVTGTALCVVHRPGTPAALWFDAAHVSRPAAQLLADRLDHLRAALRDEMIHLDEIAAVSPAEQALLDAWNDTGTEFDRALTVHRAFERQAADTPDAPALIFEDSVLSYAGLDARANRIAQVLRAMGVAPGAHVGLYLDRGPDMVAAAFAILKSGGAYVPLDPAYPADRLAHYIADSGARVIVTRDGLRGSLPDHAAEVLCVDVDTRIAAAPPVPPERGAQPDDLAYLIYTSGSTGLPKGVMVEHRNVMNFFAGMDARIEHRAGDTWLAVTSLAFDISVLEIFWTLARGFKLVLSGGDTRAMLSNGPVSRSDRHIDFNLFYWGNDDGVGPKKYELLLEGAKFADRHGFNAVWTPERHFHAFGGPYPNPSVTGAAVAAVTRNLSVRAGSCVAPLHHPARIAEEWAVIDNLTNGRAGLAIASGWQPDDFVLRPENTPPANKPAMYESIDMLRRLWRGEKVAFPTQDGTPFEVLTQPRPVSRELPVWVTTAGNPQTWREAGEIGANVLTHLLGQTIDEVGEKIVIYHDALRAAGHDPADFRVTVMLHTFLADTRAEAAEAARGPMKDYLRSAAGLIKQYAWAFPAFKRPKGASNPFDVDLSALDGDEMEAILDFAFERYFEDAGMFGTIEDGLARAEQLKRIGVDEIACLIDYGIATPRVMDSLRHVAEVLRRCNAPAEIAADDFSIAAQLVRHRVSHLQCTPSMARMIALDDDARGALRGLRHMLLGGEALPGDLLRDLRMATGAEIRNMYGPTETTIWSTTVSGLAEGCVTAPIGTPIANTQCAIKDANLRPVPIGVPGELLVAGAGVTRGYWQRTELTEERFPTGLGFAGRAYRTGDLAYWDETGTLHFLGRGDDQVKIRGQRIELGEIENAMADFPGVTQAVVVTRPGPPGDARLIGYITPIGGVDVAGLVAHLAARLPEVMVPAHIVPLDAFPVTPNKKIDRKALPDPDLHRAQQSAPAPALAEGSTEDIIAGIWTRVLGVKGIRAEDNFFALGGHSLLAVQAHREIRQALGRTDIPITDIFRFPTLGGLSRHLRGDAEPAPVEVQTPARSETMSRRRAMRAERRERAG